MRDIRNTRILWGTQVVMTFLVAVFAFFAPAHAQPLDPLVEEGVNILTEKNEIQHLQKIGKLDPTQAQEKLRATRQRWDQYWQKIPPQKQPLIQAQIRKRNAEVLAGLQQKWAAEASQSQNEASAKAAQEPVLADAHSVGNSRETKFLPDILGIHVGMTQPEVKEILKKQKHFATSTAITDERGLVFKSPFLSAIHVVWYGTATSPPETIKIKFAPSPNESRVLYMTRGVGTPLNKEPLPDVLLQSLKEKFGEPYSYQPQDWKGNQKIQNYSFFWFWDSSGKPSHLDPKDEVFISLGISACEAALNNFSIYDTLNFATAHLERALKLGCATGVRVKVQSKWRDGIEVVNDFKTTIIDFDALMSTTMRSKQYLDEVQKADTEEQLEEARKNKPSL